MSHIDIQPQIRGHPFSNQSNEANSSTISHTLQYMLWICNFVSTMIRPQVLSPISGDNKSKYISWKHYQSTVKSVEHTSRAFLWLLWEHSVSWGYLSLFNLVRKRLLFYTNNLYEYNKSILELQNSSDIFHPSSGVQLIPGFCNISHIIKNKVCTSHLNPSACSQRLHRFMGKRYFLIHMSCWNNTVCVGTVLNSKVTC